jgi:menaquinol-cytochrome c reductase iron-sulfur subunit
MTRMDRRSFLSFITVAAGAVGGALVGVPLVGRLVSPLRAPDKAPDAASEGYHSLGQLASFEEGRPTRVSFPVTVRDGWDVTTQERAAWVVRKGDEVTVMSTVCPHLGCSVKWALQKSEFGCPCHESGFAPDGARLHGPARRGLDTLPMRIVGGDVQIQWVEYVANIAEKKPIGGA